MQPIGFANFFFGRAAGENSVKKFLCLIPHFLSISAHFTRKVNNNFDA
jgi:hypothetical protein